MDDPLVSVIINNYNYARFLGDAIDSALRQTYPRTEVIVVDDGSSDKSREIMASYGNRIIPVLKENGGQASAFNEGFAVSRGELICFLDSDDMFLPLKVAEMVAARRQFPNAILYYHRLRVIDARGIPQGGPWPLNLWSGLIRDRVERSGGWWPRPTTSGLCFSRRYLERVLPIPVEGFRLCADAYVGDLAPFIGPIAGVPGILALYRQHGGNYWNHLAVVNRNSLRKQVRQYVFEHEQLKKTLTAMGISTSVSLNCHLPYLMATYTLERKPSYRQLALLTLAYPTLGYMSKMSQLMKLTISLFSHRPLK